MGKKKRKPFVKPGDKGYVGRADGKIILRSPDTVVEDKGIYQDERIVDWKATEISSDEASTLLSDAGDYAKELNRVLAEATKAAGEMLRPFAERHDINDRAILQGRVIEGGLDLGDGPSCYSFPVLVPEKKDYCSDGGEQLKATKPTTLDMSPEALEALDVVRLVREFRRTSQGKEFAFLRAIELGRLIERLDVRPLNRVTRIGKDKQQTARNARRPSLSTQEQLKAVERVEALLKTERMSKTNAYKQVAKEFLEEKPDLEELSFETVKGYCTKHWTKKT